MAKFCCIHIDEHVNVSLGNMKCISTARILLSNMSSSLHWLTSVAELPLHILF